MDTVDLIWIFVFCTIQSFTAIAVYFYVKLLVTEVPPVKPTRKVAEKRPSRSTSKRAAKRRLALECDTFENDLIVTNTIMTDLSIVSNNESISTSMSVSDPRMALPDEFMAFEALQEWNSRPISHRPPIEKVAVFISEMYLSLPYGTTDIIELSLSPANCNHLYRAFHTIRKELLFTALHTVVTVQSTIASMISADMTDIPNAVTFNSFDSPEGHDLRTYYGNIFNHISTIRAAVIPPRAAFSVLLCDLAAFLQCHKNNIQLYQSVLMTELLDGFIIYLTKMLGAKAETDLYDTKCQLYEARMLNRFSETLMQLLEDNDAIITLLRAKCNKFDLSIHGIKELAPFCFDADARLVRSNPLSKLNKLAPKYLADIIKDNDVFCTVHNIPYHLFVTRTSPFTSYENILSLVKPESDT